MQIPEAQVFDASTGVAVGLALTALSPERNSAIGGEVRPKTELKPESCSSMSGSLSLLVTALLIWDPEPWELGWFTAVQIGRNDGVRTRKRAVQTGESHLLRIRTPFRTLAPDRWF